MQIVAKTELFFVQKFVTLQNEVRCDFFSVMRDSDMRLQSLQNQPKMANKKVLFINQEIVPYVPESELSVMGSELPHKIQESGFEIRTFMPKWGSINERRRQLHEVSRLSGMNLIIDETDHPLIIKVASNPTTRLQVYFIDNEDYFLSRGETLEVESEDAPENGERAIFFARGVLETVKKLRWTPDVVQCQGWMTAVVPLYIKTAYKDDPSFAHTKVVTSLFTKQLKGQTGPNFKECLPFGEMDKDLLQHYSNDFDFLELGKLAVDYSDAVVQAVPEVDERLRQYALESGKNFMDYPGEDYAEAYTNFYNNLLG